MITTAEEYYSKLALLSNENPPIHAVLPSIENVYEVDVKTKKVTAPKFLALEKDHRSEVIYFSVDRFVDYMDLSTTCCAIWYINALGEARVYSVPFYDIYTWADKKKILFPWNLDAGVAAAPGTVQFSIQFFCVNDIEQEDGSLKKVISYNLNTLPATSQILKGMEINALNSEKLLINAEAFGILSSRIDEISKFQDLYWTVLK